MTNPLYNPLDADIQIHLSREDGQWKAVALLVAGRLSKHTNSDGTSRNYTMVWDATAVSPQEASTLALDQMVRAMFEWKLDDDKQKMSGQEIVLDHYERTYGIKYLDPYRIELENGNTLSEVPGDQGDT